MLQKNEYIESVHVTRSYSRKVKSGETYEMLDVFSSMTADVKHDAPPEEIEKISEDIYRQCVNDVETSIAEAQSNGTAMETELVKTIRKQRERIKQLEVKK